MALRILQGVTGQAGQPHTLAKAFRSLGYEAKSISIVDHPFAYQTDELIKGLDLRDPAQIQSLIESLADKFDVFHFHGRAFAPMAPELSFPCFNDLLQLKKYGKKTFFHFRGSELRERQKFAEVNPFAYSYEAGSDSLFGSQTDELKRFMKRVISDICTEVFVVDNELRTYLPNAQVVPRAIDLSEWPYMGPSKNGKPLVVHAPSRRLVKGTDHVLRAVEALQSKEIEFDFILVEGLSNSEAREIYRKADIVVDQLRIGWYGVLAVEAMALGKTVITYIRDDLISAGSHSLPLINANPNTIESALERAIKDRAFRQEISPQAREYVERVHCSEAVCKQLVDSYMAPKNLDLENSLIDLHDYQCTQLVQKTVSKLNEEKKFKEQEKIMRRKLDRGRGPVPTSTKAKLRLIWRILKSFF